MNLYAKLLFIIGWVCILSGVILGFANWEVMTIQEHAILDKTEMVEGKSFLVLLMYTIAGTITGIMMFGFSEIINLLDKKHRTQEETLKWLKDTKWEIGGLLNKKQGN